MREVFATLEHDVGDGRAVGLGFLDGLRRVDLLDRREEEDLVHFDGELARRTEHREQLALGILSGLRREARDLGDHDLTVLPAVSFGARLIDLAREDDRSAHARIVELDPRALAFATKDARHARRASAFHFDDLAFGTA